MMDEGGPASRDQLGGFKNCLKSCFEHLLQKAGFRVQGLGLRV